MPKKIRLSLLCMLLSLGIFAQGKLYIVPQVDCFFGSIKGVDSVNSKQSFIRTKRLTKKTFQVGIRLTYTNKSFGISAGIDEAIYSTAYFRNEDKSNPNRIDSRHWSAEDNGPLAIFIEPRYELFNVNVKIPKWLSYNPEKPYLIVSRVAPLFGLEYRYMRKAFINDFTENNDDLLTSQFGNIANSSLYHSYKNSQFSLRVGADLIFFNQGKKRFILTFMYHFAFNDAGYFRYHFSKPSQGIDFYYQTTTRGNGFSIKAGIPIKIFENKKVTLR